MLTATGGDRQEKGCSDMKSLIRRTGVLVAGITLATIASAAPALAASNLSWESFPSVSSQDRIEIVSSNPGAVPGGQIRVCLEASPAITWWKALISRAWNNNFVGE